MLLSWEESSRTDPILRAIFPSYGASLPCIPLHSPLVLVSNGLRFKVVFLRLMIGLFMFMGRPVWREMTRLVEDPKTFDTTEDEEVRQKAACYLRITANRLYR